MQHAASADPKDPPAIDPQYFAESADLDILVEAWKFARKVANTGAFKELMVAEVSPGPDVQTDEQIRGAQAALTRTTDILMPVHRRAREEQLRNRLAYVTQFYSIPNVWGS